MNTYFLYARKSSEDKNRQVNSTEDQIKALTRLAEERDFVIVDIIQESKSAKKPGRPEFNSMLERLHKGEADGILCWKLDRLARNPVDGGQISWMLQNNIIKHIQTHSSDYKPSDNVLMMQVELGMANQYIKDLRGNVRRGTYEKALRGWNPASVLPVGYKHNPLYLANESKEEVVPDCNFKILERLWKLLLTGAYTLADIKREGDALGLKNRNGKSFALNTYHLTFKNAFYAGVFYWKDEEGNRKEFNGLHKQMISFGDYLKVQEIFGNHSNSTRVKSRFFPYRGLIECGECAGFVTAEFVHQIICTRCKYKFSIKTNKECRFCGMHSNSMRDPVEIIKKYYRCSKKKNSNCTQKCIEEKVINQKIVEYIDNFEIDEEFYEWAIKEIERININTLSDPILVGQMKTQLKSLKRKLINYADMRAEGDITSIEFKDYTTEIKKKIESLTMSIRKEQALIDDAPSIAYDRLNLLRTSSKKYKKWNDYDKKVFISELGYNLNLKDKSLYISIPKWILYAKEQEKAFVAKMSRVQPDLSIANKGDLVGLVPLNPIRLAS